MLGQVYFVECLSKIKSILSVIFYAMYGTPCFQLTIFVDNFDNIYTLFYYNNQIRNVNH